MLPTRQSHKPVNALVYIGDAMEENIDKLAVVAGELATAQSALLHVS
jgi:hypothetical protein